MAGFRLGFDLLGPHGLFVGVGLPPTSEGNIEFNPFELFVKDATVIYSAVGTVQDMRELVDLAAAGKVKTPRVAHRIALGARRHLRRARRRASTSAARCSPTSGADAHDSRLEHLQLGVILEQVVVGEVVDQVGRRDRVEGVERPAARVRDHPFTFRFAEARDGVAGDVEGATVDAPRRVGAEPHHHR